jgi:hypothetical protein
MKIRKINPNDFFIPMQGSPDLHRNLEWYATEDNKTLGVIVLDLIDNDYGWLTLKEDPEQGLGYTFDNCKTSMETQAEAREALHKVMTKN